MNSFLLLIINILIYFLFFDVELFLSLINFVWFFFLIFSLPIILKEINFFMESRLYFKNNIFGFPKKKIAFFLQWNVFLIFFYKSLIFLNFYYKNSFNLNFFISKKIKLKKIINNYLNMEKKLLNSFFFNNSNFFIGEHFYVLPTYGKKKNLDILVLIDFFSMFLPKFWFYVAYLPYFKKKCLN